MQDARPGLPGDHLHRHGQPRRWVLAAVASAALIAGGAAIIVRLWALFPPVPALRRSRFPPARLPAPWTTPSPVPDRARVANGATDEDREAEAVFRVVLRPIASSLPLGFFAFTAGTVLLTALELQWVPVTESRQLMMLVLAFVVPLEAIAGLFAFLARDSGAATGLTTLAAAWAGTALIVLGGKPGGLSTPLAVFLLTLAALMLVMAVASVTGKPMFGLLMLVGGGRFVLTGVYEVTGRVAVEHAAGHGPHWRAASPIRCSRLSRRPECAASYSQNEAPGPGRPGCLAGAVSCSAAGR